MTENNNIPKHWQIKKLGEVLSNYELKIKNYEWTF